MRIPHTIMERSYAMDDVGVGVCSLLGESDRYADRKPMEGSYVGSRVTGDGQFAPLVDVAGKGVHEVTSPLELSDLCRNDALFMRSLCNHVSSGFTLLHHDRKETLHVVLDSLLDRIKERRADGGFDPYIHDEAKQFHNMMEACDEGTADRYMKMYRRYAGIPPYTGFFRPFW